MAASSLAALQAKAEEQYTNLKARKRSRYRLARALGFSAREAKVLSGRSELYIATLSKQLKGDAQ